MAISYVGERGKKQIGNGAGTTETLTLSSSCTAGNTLILRIGCRDTSTVVSVTDSRGNTWTVDVGAFNTGNNFAAICSTRMDAGTLVSGDTITVTWGTAPAATRNIAADEFSGLLTASYVDKTAHNGSTVAGSSFSTGTTAATTQADELAVAAYCMALPSDASIAVTGDASYSAFTTPLLFATGSGTPKQLYGQYKILSATGTQSNSVSTASNINSYQGLIVTYKAAAGPLSLDAGKVASSVAVNGADVAGSGAVTLSAGNVPTAQSVRGANITSPASSLAAGKVSSSATVRGANPRGVGAVIIPAGNVSSSQSVRGANITTFGTLSAGKVPSSGAIRGANLSPSGSAPLSAGHIASSSTVRGARIVVLLASHGVNTLTLGVEGSDTLSLALEPTDSLTLNPE